MTPQCSEHTAWPRSVKFLFRPFRPTNRKFEHLFIPAKLTRDPAGAESEELTNPFSEVPSVLRYSSSETAFVICDVRGIWGEGRLQYTYCWSKE